MCPCGSKQEMYNSFASLMNPPKTEGMVCINYDLLSSGDLKEMVKLAYFADKPSFNAKLIEFGFEPVTDFDKMADGLVAISKGNTSFDKSIPKKILNSLSLNDSRVLSGNVGIFCN